MQRKAEGSEAGPVGRRERRLTHAESGNTFRAPLVPEELTAQGWPTRRKRVARLMRQEGLVARSPK